jgi:N-methylhydantoinase B/oxoprolinase/acetone carboxylase alpha subunit
MDLKVDRDDMDDQELLQEFLRTNVAFLGPDREIIRDHKMAPRSARENKVLSGNPDIHQFDHVRGFFQGVLDDNFEITQNMIVAPAGRFGDLTTALFTGAGDHCMASTKGVIGFCACIHYPIRFVLKNYKDDPAVGVNPGDCFIFNDPFYGGLHSPDQSAFMPVFHEGELVAWVACGMHEGEDGAKEPGGMGPGMESPFDEGLKMPPIKYAENYRLRTDYVTFLQNSCRDPRMFGADLKTRLATCIRLEKAVKRAIEEHGVDAVVGAFRQNIEYVAEEVQRRIADLPEGTVRAHTFLDTTMREDALLRIFLTATVKDGKMTFDFKGSSPQIFNRPINSGLTMMKVLLSNSLLCFVWPDLPRVNAVLEHIEFITEENTICDCSRDVPSCLSMQVMFKGLTLAHLAAVKFYYSCNRKYANIIAPWFNQTVSFVYGGITQHNEMTGNLCADLNGMPGGAHWNDDGQHSMAMHLAAMTDCGESEFTEEELPFMQVVSKRLFKDNVGFGKFRGGSGYQYSATMQGSPLWGFSAVAGGSKFSSNSGLFGGYGCPAYPIAKIKNLNIFEQIKTQPEVFEPDMIYIMNERPFKGGDYVTQRGSMPYELCTEGELYMASQGAGGGYGDLLDRDPARVMTDLEEDLISHETARDLLFVVYDEETLVVDQAGTNAARLAEKQARIARGKSYDDFVEEWVKEGPPENVPYYGGWGEDHQTLYADGLSMPADAIETIMLPDPKDVEIAKLKKSLSEMEGRLNKSGQ